MLVQKYIYSLFENTPHEKPTPHRKTQLIYNTTQLTGFYTIRIPPKGISEQTIKN